MFSVVSGEEDDERGESSIIVSPLSSAASIISADLSNTSFGSLFTLELIENIESIRSLAMSSRVSCKVQCQGVDALQKAPVHPCAT